MVRRRSTVRFRNGAPGKRHNSNTSNRPWGPFRGPIGPGSSQARDHVGIGLFLPVSGAMRFGRLCLGPARPRGGPSAWRAAWTGSPGARAIALLDLGQPPFGRDELAVGAGGYVAVGQHAGQLLWRGLELQVQDAGESAFFGFDDGAGVVGDQPAQKGVGVLGVAQV